MGFFNPFLTRKTKRRLIHSYTIHHMIVSLAESVFHKCILGIAGWFDAIYTTMYCDPAAVVDIPLSRMDRLKPY